MEKDVTKNSMFKSLTPKKVFFIAAIAICGVLLMLTGTDEGEAQSAKLDIDRLDPGRYAQEAEERIEDICDRIDGVSSTHAVVTLRGGYKAIYATDLQSGSTSLKNQTVIIGSGSAEQGLLIGYENPEIAGIGIVCSGGDDAGIKKNIISVISSAFNVSSNKIFVAGS
jgi:stage III sporulation protein AG